MNAPTQIDDYLRQANGWHEEVVTKTKRYERLAWLIAAAAVLIAAGAIAALMAAIPLKQAVPYVIQVDKGTGAVEVITTLNGLDPTALALHENEAVTMSNLVRYVTARETYEFSDHPERWDLMRLWSTRDVFDGYRQILADPNRDPRRSMTRRTVEIVSVQLLNRSTAAVRFRATTYVDTGASTTANYAAVVNFRYAALPYTLKERFINPLGFQVSSYRLDTETL